MLYTFNFRILNLQMKLSKLIFMVRFIKILEQIWQIEPRRARETEVTIRLVPMKPIKNAQKINEDWLLFSRRAIGCHKV